MLIPILLLQYAMLSLDEQGKPDPGQFTILDHGNDT